MRFRGLVVVVLLGCSSSGSSGGDEGKGEAAEPKVVDLSGVGLRFDLPAGADASEAGETASLTQGSCTVTFAKAEAKDARTSLDDIFARMKARPGFVEKTSHALTVKGPSVEWTEKNDAGALVYALERLTFYDKDAVYQIQGQCTDEDDVLPLRLTLRDKVSLLP